MNSNLQNKLQQFSATPPDGMWDKIADALDANDAIYAQRLYRYEEQPPADTWLRIEENLEENTPAKVMPFTTRFRTPLRYIAAASILAVVLVTATLLLKRTEAGALQAGSNTTVPQSNSTTIIRNSDAPAKNTTAQTGETAQPQAGISKKNEGKEAGSTGKNDQLIVAENKNTNKPDRTKAVYSSMNNYVLFSDGDGKLRRVSKKLASLVKCKEGDGSCQQRLQQLRQKMAAKAMTTDFTGILEMLRQLQ